MRKIVLAFFLLMSGFFAMGAEVASQEKILKELLPLLEKAEIYEKYKEIEAKEAEGGEVIKTVTSDGLETENKAEKGDYIVKNLTEAGEQYIIRKDKFKMRYEYLETGTDRFKRYKAIGKIKAIAVSEDVMKLLNRKEEFFFMAPWGQKMIVKEGDYLVSPLDYSEVYRIAQKEFFETYRLQE